MCGLIFFFKQESFFQVKYPFVQMGLGAFLEPRLLRVWVSRHWQGSSNLDTQAHLTGDTYILMAGRLVGWIFLYPASF